MPTCLLLLWVMAHGVYSQQDTHRKIFYREMTEFRHDPFGYLKNHTGVQVRCTAPLGESYRPLHVSPLLEESSMFQSSTMASSECLEISHQTCPIYCHQFGDCSFQSRMDWFLRDTPNHNNLEIMIRGMKDPQRIFQQFLGSEKHCNHILDCHINAMGVSFSHADRNVMVADFSYLE